MPSQEEYLDDLLKGTAKVPAEDVDLDSLDLGDLDIPGMDLNDLGSFDMSDIMSQETEDAQDGIDMSDMDALLQSVGEEDVDKLLRESRQSSEADSEMNNVPDADVLASDDDLMSLLNDSGDDDLQEIQNLLQKSDNNEAVDDSIMPMAEGNQDGDGAGEPGTENGAVSEKARKAAERKKMREEKKEAKRLAKEAKKAKKGRKADKEENTEAATVTEQADNQDSDISDEMDGFLSTALGAEEDGIGAEYAALDDVLGSAQEKEKEKKGFFTKILDFFTEEYDEDDDENENIQLSDENQAILNEMKKDKGKGKKKEKKPKKDKKGKKVNSDAEGEEASESNDGEEKKDKKKKKEKKPKEKPEAEQLNEKPEKKLPRKPIILVAVVCASLTAILLIVTNLLGDFNVKRAGRAAYYEGDYQTCYQNLYGRDLNESEQVMYSRSECILRIRLWMSEYEMLAAEGDRVKALDSLIQSVNDYPALYDYALLWNSGADVSEVYGQMTAILEEEYHLTAEQALEIAAEPDDVVYTRKVTAAAEGEIYGSAQEIPEAPLQDVLPEEEGIDNSNFIDNSL